MSVLTKIVDQRKLDVAEAKLRVSASELTERIAAQTSGPGDFVAVLRRQAPMGLLAEIKRASPSKGDIAIGVNAPAQALQYALAGACTISVLTEPKWFKGSLADMAAVRAALEAACLSPGVCVLRKDFVVDEYQLLEARAHGADTVLLIVAVLGAEELSRLMAASRKLGMEPLVEAANEEEMRVALEAGARVIGVNNRNLHTFEVDMGTTGRCAAMIPPGSDVVLIALSGVATRADVVPFSEVGAAAVLVGESLMRAPSAAALIRELLAVTGVERPLCKVCGLRDAEAAQVAADAGADLLGLIFAKSKRQVTEAEAAAIARAVRSRRPRPEGWRMPRVEIGSGDAVKVGEWFGTWRSLLSRAAAGGGPLLVGVFVDATAEEMNETAERVGLDLIQLHGSEGWEVASKLVRPAVRVVHMDAGSDAEHVCGQLRGGEAVAVLLDTKGGGTGKTFDWEVGAAVQRQTPFILAGGLHPANVAEAVKQVRPWCVDVSSGVESDGVKDHAKITAFVTNAKAAL